MGKKILNYQELKEAYRELLNERADELELIKENEKLKETIKKQKKKIIDLSMLLDVKVSEINGKR